MSLPILKHLPQFILAVMMGALPGNPAAAEPVFQYEYTPGGALPEEAHPQWKRFKAGKPVVTLEAKTLKAEINGGDRCLFVIGTFAKTVCGDIAAWNMASGVATVEFRLRCHADASDFTVFRFQLTDGRKSWVVPFTNQTVNGVQVDTSEMDTYRIAAKDGVVQISSERHGLISKAHRAASATNYHCIIFGTQVIANRPIATGVRGGWELEFIRWTNEVADMEVLGRR